MRMKAGDPGAQFAEILVNGEKVDLVVAADETAGTADQLVTDAQGRCTHNDEGTGAETRRLTGMVEIRILNNPHWRRDGDRIVAKEGTS